MSSANLFNKLSVYSSMFYKHIKLKQCFKYSNKRGIITSASNPFKSAIISENPSGTFRFSDYDCLGFDLDNTVLRYKVGNMLKMEYEALSTFLVEQKGYPATHLRRPLEQNKDFLLKGLILDYQNGNILKIDVNGKILRASHGTKSMTETEIKEQYGSNCHWTITDTFCKDLLATWNGPLSEQMRTLLDYFDMPAGLAFARLVDTLDEAAGKRLPKYELYADLLAGLVNMYDRDHFRLNKGGYFPLMKTSPDLYIEKCDRAVIDWLKALKADNKVLFLITGSNVDFASFTASTALGADWKELFDIVIFFSKKPGFFTLQRPFLSIDGNKEGRPVTGSELKIGGSYSQGNWTDLFSFLSAVTKKEKPRVTYIGDNLIQDVYTPAVHTQCDTVAVVEELQAEGAFGFPKSHVDADTLISKEWGSFFSNNDDNTIWIDIIRKYSKLCIPSLEFVAANSIHHEYKLH